MADKKKISKLALFKDMPPVKIKGIDIIPFVEFIKFRDELSELLNMWTITTSVVDEMMKGKRPLFHYLVSRLYRNHHETVKIIRKLYDETDKTIDEYLMKISPKGKEN